MSRLNASLLLGCLLGCPPPPPQAPPRPGPVVIIPGAGCAQACSRLRELECEPGTPTPNGHSCEQVCEHTMAGPKAIRWDTECLAAASSCTACDPVSLR